MDGFHPADGVQPDWKALLLMWFLSISVETEREEDFSVLVKSSELEKGPLWKFISILKIDIF